MKHKVNRSTDLLFRIVLMVFALNIGFHILPNTLQAMPLVIAESSARVTVSLNGTWQVNGEKYSGPAQVQVPGMIRFIAGITTWTKSFSLDLSDRPQSAYLEFGGVVNEGVVRLNGNLVGALRSYTFSRLDVAGFLNISGENILEVELDDRMTSTTVPGGPVEGLIELTGDDTYYAFSVPWTPNPGIFRDVFLVYSYRHLIENVFARTELNDQLNQSTTVVTIRFKRGLAQDLHAQVAMSDKDTNTVVGTCMAVDTGTNEISCSIQLDSPKLWSPETPHLYNFFVALVDMVGEADAIRDYIGIRKIEIQGSQFLLNNKRLFLRGISRHDIYGENWLVSNPSTIETDLLWLKELGVNYVRSIHYPPSEDFMRKADELGIIVSEEIPAFACLGLPGNISKSTKMMISMVERDYNRPSVLFWLAGSGTGSLQESYHGAELYYPVVRDEIKKIDDQRPISFVFDDAPSTGEKVLENASYAKSLGMDFYAQNGYWNEYMINIAVPVLPNDMPVLITEWSGSEGSDIGPLGVPGIQAFPNYTDVFGNGVFPEWYQTWNILRAFSGWLPHLQVLPQENPPISGLVFYNWQDHDWMGIVFDKPGHFSTIRNGLVYEDRTPKGMPLAIFQYIMSWLQATLNAD